MKTALAAYVHGWGRAWRAPAVLFGVFVMTYAVAVPARHLLRADIAEGLGHSLVANDMASGVSLEWWDQYLESATGLGQSFTPRVIGFAAVLDNLSRAFDNEPNVPAVAALCAGYLVIWLFLVGGIIDRLARNRQVRTQAFFAACGSFFVRFLRLGVVAAAGYGVLLLFVHGWLFDGVYRFATRNMTAEREAFAVRLALYVLFGALVVTWSLMIDYAKVRAVVEDRRSMLGAMMAGSRFALKHPLKTGLLWTLNALGLVALWAMYAIVVPGAAGSGSTVWIGFAIGQLYVLLRLFLKLVNYASQAALVQSMLAHSAYVAAPLAPWPASPKTEPDANRSA
jgi:hypothetical protein